MTITQVEFPNPVDSGQVFDIRVHISATFIMTRGHFATGRVDLLQMWGETIAIRAFDLGYASTQTTKTTTVTFTVRAPTTQGDWQLRLNAYCISTVSGDSQIDASASRILTIRIGQPSIQTETLTQIDALLNGDFEQALNLWETIGRTGYSKLSTQIAHSGSALQLDLLTRPDVSMGVETIQGVRQSITVTNLRSLRVEVYFLMMQKATQTRARIQIQIGDLTVNYYVAYDNQALISGTDTLTRKSIFVENIAPGGLGWATWLFLRRNVADDFTTQFGILGSNVFQKAQIQIQIALELIGIGALTDHQFMYWDDVKLTGFVPVGTPNPVTQTSISTSLQASTPAIEPLTVTETKTVSVSLLPVLTYEQVYQLLAAIFAAAFGVTLVLLIKSQRKR